MAIIKTEKLTKAFGRLVAVNELSLEVEPGEVFGLLGPNGAGKTTAIRMLITLMRPTGGKAWVGGLDVRKSPLAVRRLIGYVPQAVSADSDLSGYENLLIFAKLYDVPRSQREKRIAEILEFMGLTGFAHSLVRTYSGGMIRRLEIAEAFISLPQVLFLDEPTLGLDPVARRGVWELIQKARTEFGMTIFFTTHYMEEADGECSRLAIMDSGRLTAIGTPQELKEGTGNPKATLDDVFSFYTGSALDAGASYRETRQMRRTVRRYG